MSRLALEVMTSLQKFESIRSERAAQRLEGVLERTELVPFPSGDENIQLRLKLECLQETGSFKARGAWNQVSQLSSEERAAGVVATSSGNHGKALSWAAQRAGVSATIFMPADAYPNKIAACREFGAQVVLSSSREAAEAACRERMQAGAVLVHPYDAERTIEGAGTVGLEIAQEWPDVDVVILPVGGGGLISGSALALRRALGPKVQIIGVEPEGAPSMSRGLAAGQPVSLSTINTKVQGLCPLDSGKLNIEIAAACVDRVETIEDAPVFAAQARLIQHGGWPIEPAGAASSAFVFDGRLTVTGPPKAGRRLNVVAVVSGGNAAPEQLTALFATGSQ